MTRIRKLIPNDEYLLESFLKRHPETTMFLRNNLYYSGLEYKAAKFHGEYLGAFDESGNINGTLAHYWNGNLMMQCENQGILLSLIAEFKNFVNRKVAGILGDEWQAKLMMEQLGLATKIFAINSAEGLYKLELQNLIMPDPFKQTSFQLIKAKLCDATLLANWFTDYHIEALGAVKGKALEKAIKNEVENTLDNETRWVLVKGKIPVSLCGFNAELPDIVQIGPVWTPTEYRNQGFARLVVALSLLDARKKGVKQAILFTNNQAAERAYLSLGFNKIGRFRLALLKKSVFIKAHT